MKIGPNLRGNVFEELVKACLQEQGYEVVSPNSGYPDVVRENGKLNLKGRGTKHQIDALGQSEFEMPFTFRTRLISEAKCYKKSTSVGIDVIRDLKGVLDDVSQNYFVREGDDLIDKSRFNDCGVIFSTSGFSDDAQDYAFAHGIYLVSVPGLYQMTYDVIKEEYLGPEEPENEEEAVSNYLQRAKNSNQEIPELYFGLISGTHPIVLKTYDEGFLDEFGQRDVVEGVKVGYEEREGSISNFQLRKNGREAEFELPEEMWKEYFQDDEYREKMLDFKQEYLQEIKLPLIIDGMRRLVTFRLDEGWVEAQREILSDE